MLTKAMRIMLAVVRPLIITLNVIFVLISIWGISTTTDHTVAVAWFIGLVTNLFSFVLWVQPEAPEEEGE